MASDVGNEIMDLAMYLHRYEGKGTNYCHHNYSKEG